MRAFVARVESWRKGRTSMERSQPEEQDTTADRKVKRVGGQSALGRRVRAKGRNRNGKRQSPERMEAGDGLGRGGMLKTSERCGVFSVEGKEKRGKKRRNKTDNQRGARVGHAKAAIRCQEGIGGWTKMSKNTRII